MLAAIVAVVGIVSIFFVIGLAIMHEQAKHDDD